MVKNILPSSTPAWMVAAFLGLMIILIPAVHSRADPDYGIFPDLHDYNMSASLPGEMNQPVLDPLTRSMLLPGWGQYANGQKVKGSALISLFGIGIGMSLYYGIEGSGYYDEYKDADNPAQASKFRHLTKQADKRRNQAIMATGIIWGLSLLDMLLSDKDRGKNDELDQP